jgi:hypothetical protein
VAAGLGGIELTDVRFERSGAVLTLPSLRLDGPWIASAIGRRAVIRRLVAAGWTLDLSHARGRIAASPPRARLLRGPGDAVPSLVSKAWADDAVAPVLTPPVFEGLLERLRLPIPVRLDDLEVEGDVVLPASHGWPADRVHLAVSGGGLAPGAEGSFAFDVRAAPGGGPVSAVEFEGTLAAGMDTPRTFDRLAIRGDASATGGKLPAPVRLTANLATSRTPAGEDYTLVLANADKRLALIHAIYPASEHRLTGTWLLDLGDDDLTPFALGRPLPAFTAAGEGRFDTDAAWTRLQASGRFNASVDRLGVLRPQLGAIGSLRLTAEFDLALRDGDLRVDRLTATLAGAQPFAGVRALQAFEFNARTGELKVADPDRDLLGFELSGLPLGWMQPFLPAGWVASAADLSGSFGARAGGGGLALRAKSPLAVTGLSIVRGGRPIVDALDVSLALSADYTPRGWQVQIVRADARHAGGKVLDLSARIGQLAGPNEQVKAAGRLTANLPALLAQPALSGLPPAPAGGTLVAEFAASLGSRRSYEVRLALSGLSDGSGEDGITGGSADIRADVDAGGRWLFSAPISWDRPGGESDVAVSGTIEPAGSGPELEARLVSRRLGIPDGPILGAALAALPSRWPEARGRIACEVGRLDGAPFPVSGGEATVKFSDGILQLGDCRAGIGDGSRIEGGCRFVLSGGAVARYEMDASVHNLASGPLLAELEPGRPPILEGRFDATLHAEGAGGDLSALPGLVRGRVQLTSRGGIFRALRTDVADAVKQSPSFLSDTMRAFGSLLGGKPDKEAEAKRWFDKQAQAVVQIADQLREVRYDQLDLAAEVGPDGAVEIRQLALISPELRIEGTGRIDGEPGAPFAGRPLGLDLRLAARGKTGDLMNQVGLLGSRKDGLGYTEFSDPVHLGGTLADVDDSQWKALLVKAAVRKAAGSLLDKLF